MDRGVILACVLLVACEAKDGIMPVEVPCPHDFLKRDPFGVCVCVDETKVFNLDTEVCEDPGTISECTMVGGDCSADTQSCCNGSTCVDFGNGVAGCAANCSTGQDCAECCCIPLQYGSVCAINVCSGACEGECSAVNSLCDTDSDCCGSAVGDAFCVNDPGYGLSCAASCETNEDCQSGCCAPLMNGGSACSNPELCGSPITSAPTGPTSIGRGWGHRVDVGESTIAL